MKTGALLRIPAWMRTALLALPALALALLFGLAPARTHAAAPVGIITIDGAIGPASADYIVRGIARAEAQRHGLLIIRMDTPGGLDTAMRTAIKAILTSPVPVVTWVAPGGARAARAGPDIRYASHVAAMAPGTNLGAATPVEIGIGGPQEPAPPRAQPPPEGGSRTGGGNDTGLPKSGTGGAGGTAGGARGNAGERGNVGTQQKPAAAPAAAPASAPAESSALTRKQVNDAAAYLRGLAQLRGRNADWAERAVREAVSLTAAEALREGVIEVVAPDLPSLLAQLDGRSVLVRGEARRLSTKDAAVVELLPDWRTDVLGAIANPSLALLLMTIGVYGLVFEFMNPGYVAPGVIGAICLLLGLYALQMLPVNYAGLALIFLGLMFMGAEAFLPSFGVLGLGGIVAFVAGGLMLIDTELPGYGIPPVLIGTLAIASALLLAGSARLALATRRRPVTSGAASLIGALATVENVAPLDPRAGWVRIEGELWQAASAQPLRQARAVRIVARSGLVLQVEAVDPQPGAAS
jgi:membrane-bound serine protease (ClpP class)